MWCISIREIVLISYYCKVWPVGVMLVVLWLILIRSLIKSVRLISIQTSNESQLSLYCTQTLRKIIASYSDLYQKNLNSAISQCFLSMNHQLKMTQSHSVFLVIHTHSQKCKSVGIGVCRAVCSCECLFSLQEIRATSNIMWNMLELFCNLLCSYMFQVQNLNNIMAFPLENVLKSELRDSRLVSLDCIHETLIKLLTKLVHTW